MCERMEQQEGVDVTLAHLDAIEQAFEDAWQVDVYLEAFASLRHEATKQQRTRDCAMLDSFADVNRALERRDARAALVYLLEDAEVRTLLSSTLYSMLLPVVAARLEEEGERFAAMVAWEDCDEEDATDRANALRDELGFDEYREKKEWESLALAVYEEQVERNDTSAEHWLRLAFYSRLIGREQRALEAAKACLAIDYQCWDAHQICLDVWESQRKHEQAETHLQALVARLPHEPWGHRAMALFLQSAKRHTVEAYVCAEKAHDMQPNDEDTNEVLADLLRRLERWDELVIVWEQMLEQTTLRFQRVELLDDLADVYANHLEGDEQAAFYQRESERLQSLSIALEDALQALEREPQEVFVWEQFRTICEEAGRWELLAKKSLERLESLTETAKQAALLEDVFAMFHQFFPSPPWHELDRFLTQQIKRATTPEQRSLCLYYHDWVERELEAVAEVGVPVIPLEEATEMERVQRLAFGYGARLYPWRRVLGFGSLLAIIPLVLVIVGPFAAMSRNLAVLALCVVIVLFQIYWWVVLGGRGPVGRCALCGSQSLSFDLLPASDPMFPLAQKESQERPFTYHCQVCSFDSRLVYFPGTSGLVKRAVALHEVLVAAREWLSLWEAVCEDAPRKASVGDPFAVSTPEGRLLIGMKALWNAYIQWQGLVPDEPHLLRECLLALPGLQFLRETGPTVWRQLERGTEPLWYEHDWVDEQRQHMISVTTQEREASWKRVGELVEKWEEELSTSQEELLRQASGLPGVHS